MRVTEAFDEDGTITDDVFTRMSDWLGRGE